VPGTAAERLLNASGKELFSFSPNVEPNRDKREQGGSRSGRAEYVLCCSCEV